MKAEVDQMAILTKHCCISKAAQVLILAKKLRQIRCVKQVSIIFMHIYLMLMEWIMYDF